MSQQVDVNIRMDRDLKNSADILFNNMGLNMTTAINAFVRQCLREECIPFKIKPYNDYKAKIKSALQEADRGRLIPFTLNELEILEDMETDKAREVIDARRRESSL